MKSSLEQSCDGNFAGYFSSADKWGVTENREMYVYKSVAESRVANVVIGAISLATQSPAVAGGGKAPVSACKPLCAIFLRKPRVYPLSSVKANVNHLCEKLKNAMRSGLEQRCDGNFWTIFAGTIWGEKPNFTGRFFKWRRPFDFSTDRL